MDIKILKTYIIEYYSKDNTAVEKLLNRLFTLGNLTESQLIALDDLLEEVKSSSWNQGVVAAFMPH